jgi:hypothetical protein
MFGTMDSLENTVVQGAATTRPWRRPRLPTEPQQRRVEELRRAFQRTLKRKPTLVEKADILRAAALVARAEAAALDPNADIHQVIRINNLANRILRSLGFKFAPPPPPPRFSPMKVLREAEAARKAQQANAGTEAQREATADEESFHEHPAQPAE